MKLLPIALCAVCFLSNLTGRRAVSQAPEASQAGSSQSQVQDGALTPVPETTEPAAPEDEGGETAITLTIGGQVFSAVLYDNAAADALLARLPLTLDMSELNGNEKYFYLDERLPTEASRPGRIQAGDLMLYGSDCLVLFYESFSSGYSYTPLGRLDDPSGLAEAVGGRGVTVAFAPGH